MSSDSPTLAVPGVLHVEASGAAGVVTTGPAAGWITPKGVREWSHELSIIARKDLTDALREELGVTLPENRIARSRHPHAHRAAESLSLVGVVSDIAPKLVEKGVRVHTVGFDRVSGGFMYFAEGGKDEPLRVHGDLLEMLAPALEGGSSNADIERYLDRFIDRLLMHFSKGLLSEGAVELANALPRLATDARGLAGVDLDAFEAEAASNADKSKKHEDGAKKLAETLEKANGGANVAVPLFGEAKSQTQPAMDIVVDGATVTLPARTLWTVSGAIREEVKPAAKPVVEEKPAAAPAKPVEKAAKVVEKPAPSPKPAPVAAKPAEKPAPSPKPAPVAAKPAEKPAPAAKPVVTPSPAPASAKPKAERLPTPAPGKIPNVLAAKPVEKPPISAPRPERTSTPEPAKAEPAVEVVKAAPVVAVGEPATEVAKVEAKPEPVVEAKPEPVVEAKPEPKPEAKPEPKPEAKPEPKPEAKPEPKPEAKPEPKAAKAKPEPKVEPKPEPKAEAKPVPAPEAKPAAPAPEAKSNTMVFVVLAILVLAAIAFFAMKK